MTFVDQSISRVRAWLAGSSEPRARLAELAAVDEKHLRLALQADWNPTAATLRRIEKALPAPADKRPRRKVAA